jgi:glycosyltransferase involved in cell wall biosynthesis
MELVSIIMPCFNNEKSISSSIESVLAQTYSNWELLICDDASFDNSRALIQRFQTIDSRVKVLSNHYVTLALMLL